MSGRAGPIVAWGLWDWGSAAFNVVVTTFVFTVYLTGSAFGPDASVDALLGWTLAGAGALVALLAPITGQRADTSGHRTRLLGVNTFLVVGLTLAMFFVRPAPEFLPLGLLLLAAATVCFEFAGVQYNALLPRVSTPATVGKVSGFGWGMGYVGGIALLLIAFFTLLEPAVGLFGVSDEDGLDVRATMLLAGLWFAIFSIPALLTLRDRAGPARAPGPRRVGLIESYRRLGRHVVTLWRETPNTVRFLIASAVFRDGLVGVFTFGGVLASSVFGFSRREVLVFAIVINVVAGISTVLVGVLDDRLGPKPVIVASLVGVLVSGGVLFVLRDAGAWVFWAAGLTLGLFVGPAQSASRTFLTRLIPAGHEGEVFGLYATTGRAVSFLAPAAFAGFVALGGAPAFGILGLLLVVAVGLALVLWVPAPGSSRAGSPANVERGTPDT
jgi:UMF1 family MFS transporter